MATSYKGGPYTIKSGGVGVVDDYVFRVLPSGRWTKIYVRIRGGKSVFEQDKEALKFILQMREHTNRICVPDAQRIVSQREKRPNFQSMSAYEYAYGTSPEFRAGQDNESSPPDFNVTQAGTKTLQCVLLRQRWDNQGGFPGYLGDNEWAFRATTLEVSASEFNILLEMAGIIPDKIESLGSCKDCANSVNGIERGYLEPCLTCLRPKMSNFKAIEEAIDD